MQQVKKPKKPLIFYYVLVLLVMFVLNTFVVPGFLKHQIKEVDYGTFLTMLDDKEVAMAQVEDDVIYFTDNNKDNPTYYSTVPFPNDTSLVDRLMASGCDFGAVQEQNSSLFDQIILVVIQIAIFVAIGQILSRMLMKKMGGGGLGNAMQFGKSNAKIYVASETGIKFHDVAGEDEAKEQLQEIVDFLHNLAKYQAIGATMPKGALLVGPPGTGKTLLAKAVAGEAEVPFFSISGSEFVEMFVGMGAAKVRDLFKQANEKAPCIVFIDEIDTIGKKRDGSGMGGNDEREQTLNQLLTEMDGFDGSKGVVILAATNRPETLDPALLRPGRFDRRIPVELPDLIGREAILKVHAKKVKLGDDVDFHAMARAAAGASGAELANMINEAALRAVRSGRTYVNQSDLEESIEVVIAGYQKKNAVLSDKEKLIVAYHETGHALVAALQSHSAPVTKITIIPRTSGALGYTMQVEEHDQYLLSKEELENKIATYAGGRAAEALIFGSITTGASNDIEQMTKLARGMITRYGMSDEFGMMALETVNNQYMGGDTSLACAAETAAVVDEKVKALLKKEYDKAMTLLTENKQQLHALAKYLYEVLLLQSEGCLLHSAHSISHYHDCILLHGLCCKRRSHELLNGPDQFHQSDLEEVWNFQK